MTEWLDNIWGDDQGQDVAEYAVMLAFILVIAGCAVYVESNSVQP